MTFVVEDGTAPEGANAYVSLDAAISYAEAHGLTFAASPSAEGEAAIVRATSSIDALYGSRFPGTRTNGRDQSLLWPRSGAEDAEGLAIASDEIPQEIIDATCEFAIRELAETGSTNPDLDRGGAVRRLKAGSVEIEYAGNASAGTVFSIVDGILAGLLGSAQATFIGTAVRG